MTFRIKSALIAAAAVMALSINTKVAKADEWNKETRVTFSAPVQVYHTKLPAGTYIFKLADSLASRDIVQVFSADRQHLLTTFLAVTNVGRPKSSSSNVILDHETSDNPVVSKWFYPSDEDGRQFPLSR